MLGFCSSSAGLASSACSVFVEALLGLLLSLTRREVEGVRGSKRHAWFRGLHMDSPTAWANEGMPARRAAGA